MPKNAVSSGDLAARVAKLDWAVLHEQLHTTGFANTNQLLSAPECVAWREQYASDHLFRSRVVMARHGFGQGEYKYFNYPLPDAVQQLRTVFYAHLAPVANAWAEATGQSISYPETHQEMLARCHQAGQLRPTPLLLKYQKDDYNCLHQDLYGEHLFPLQVVILLSAPGDEFEGGELVMTEQRPRMQSRAHVLPLRQGEAVIFAVNERPVTGTRGTYRVKMRHGVSKLRRGERYTTGLIFHDAL
jgi:uncharacterized protein